MKLDITGTLGQNQWRIDGHEEGDDQFPLVEVNFKNEAAELPYEKKEEIAIAMLRVAMDALAQPATDTKGNPNDNS